MIIVPDSYGSAFAAANDCHLPADRRQHLVFDGTMGNPEENYQMMKLLRDRGYRIEIRFVDVPVTTSLERAVERFIKRGRYVPPSYIRQLARMVDGKVVSRNFQSFLALREYADAYAVYDGTTRGKGPKERQGKLSEVAAMTKTKPTTGRSLASEVLERAEEKTRTPAEWEAAQKFAEWYLKQDAAFPRRQEKAR